MVELISIHIAKTGGISFYEILKNEYGDKVDPRHKRIHFFPGKDYSNRLINRIPDHVTVMHGHLLYEHIREIHEKYDPKIITWLREPADRVISNYFYLMHRTREIKDHPQKHKKNYTLLEYARDSIPNKMSHYLRGISLEELYFIGFQESFRQDIKSLAGLLNWKKPVPEVHLHDRSDFNKTSSYPTPEDEITAGMRDEIRNINSEDVLLYEKALKLRNEGFGN